MTGTSGHFNDMVLEPVEPPAPPPARYSSLDSLTAAAGDPAPTGAVIVALPADSDPVNGIGDEQKHCTLVWLGDDVAQADADAVMAAVSGWVSAAPAPFTEPVTGVDSLGDDGARVWMLDGSTTATVQTALLGLDAVKALYDAAEQYPSYTPHVTIGYPADAPADAEDVTDDDAPDPTEGDTPVDTTLLDEPTETAAAAVTSIMFDRLALWYGTDQTVIPLPTDAPAPADTPAVAAAADVPAAGAAPAGGPALAQDIPADGDPFYGILWPEAVMSGDARQIAADGTVWRDLPLPLMSQEATMPGHDGAVRVGRIDTITRDADTYSTPVIRYSGVWDTSPAAIETARQVDAKMLRGVSVDGDDVTVELQGSDGQPLDPMTDDFPEDGVVVETATSARVAGATCCSIPAFQQAYIANGTYEAGTKEPGWTASGDAIPSGAVPDGPADEPALVASAWTLVASGQPVFALSDFSNPGLEEPTPLTVTPDGRVYGHLAVWGTCHIGIDGICQEPPDSPSNYAYFATGSVDTDEGYVSTGVLTMGTGHANMRLTYRPATEHYDNTGSAVADVAMGQDGIGIWYAGRVRPGTTEAQVYALKAAGAASGDWRKIGGTLELVAALVVNVPGFPIPRTAVAASGGRAAALVASGVVRPPAGPQARSSRVTINVADMTTHDFEAFAIQLDRFNRVRVAKSRIRANRVAAAAERIER